MEKSLRRSELNSPSTTGTSVRIDRADGNNEGISLCIVPNAGPGRFSDGALSSSATKESKKLKREKKPRKKRKLSSSGTGDERPHRSRREASSDQLFADDSYMQEQIIAAKREKRHRSVASGDIGEDHSPRTSNNTLAGKRGKKKSKEAKALTKERTKQATSAPTEGLNTKKKSRKLKDTAAASASALAAATAGDSGGNGYSAAQNAVNDMMRRALEEDQYSALGSIVDTESSDEDEENAVFIPMQSSKARQASHGKIGATGTADISTVSVAAGEKDNGKNNSSTTYTRLDRACIVSAMKKRVRMEAVRHSSSAFRTHGLGIICELDLKNSSSENKDAGREGDDEGCAKKGRKVGGRKKKPADGGKGEDSSNGDLDEESSQNNKFDRSDGDGTDQADDDGSIFGQSTANSSNAMWVECDRCHKWRRLRGVVDAKKLPSKWYCNMNKNDLERSKCTAPEEEYDTPAATPPESAADMRVRKHLRLWVRRLQCNEAYEARMPTMTRQKKKSAQSSSKEPYEWIRCCNPSCGKWRAVLKFMDAKSMVLDNARNGEWYCVLNTWDEKVASCAAPQENLPAIGCPPWVMRDGDTS